MADRKLNPKDAAALNRAPLHLVPAAGEIHAAVATRQGAIDYGPYNWRETPISMMEYLGALKRHIDRCIDGEDVDPKSGAHPLGHVIATSAIILDAQECGMLIDDRPEPGKAAEMLERIEADLKAKAGAKKKG